MQKKINNLTFEYESEKLKDGSFIVKGRLVGDVEVECIKCLKEFNKAVDEEVKFKVVKPPFNGFDEKYDIIEMENFSIDELLNSEIELIKNDYNICNSCLNEDFNKEF